MGQHHSIIIGLSLAAFLAVNWVGPRYFGLAGMVGGHLVVLFGWFYLAVLAMDAGRYEYDGAMTIIGLAVQAFVLNCLMLPVAGVALWRRRRAARRVAG
jgi:hypothetical protein